MASTPTISIESPRPSSRASLDSSTAASRLSSESQRSYTSGATGSIRLNRQQPGAGSSVAAASRRNRSALREFYGLKRREDENPTVNTTIIGLGVSSSGNEVPCSPSSDVAVSTELDKTGFDAQEYVDKLVARENLQGLLKVENGLINDIRGFDGERKSLVYDNYNKLIAATDTIRNMRSNMDPLTPATITLSPAISHIASVSASLVETVHTPTTAVPITASSMESELNQTVRQKKAETVKWVLQAPERMEKLLKAGRRDDAVKEWNLAKASISKWKNVKGSGVEELMKRGELVLERGQ